MFLGSSRVTRSRMLINLFLASVNKQIDKQTQTKAAEDSSSKKGQHRASDG